MSNFEQYAAYYDALYAAKDYAAEAKYIDQMIAVFAPSMRRSALLDIGCGTGRHARQLAALGYRVTGIDRSPAMIALAQRAGEADFLVADAASFKFPDRFGVVVSLFHVMSYHTSNAQLEAACNAAYANLEPGGLFIFDFWYGPAVLSDLPTERSICVETPQKIIRRLTRPTMREADDCVDIEFQMTVEDRQGHATERFNETHPMRYFFQPELKRLLSSVGFKVLAVNKWMAMDRAPSIKDRDVILVAQK